MDKEMAGAHIPTNLPTAKIDDTLRKLAIQAGWTNESTKAQLEHINEYVAELIKDRERLEWFFKYWRYIDYGQTGKDEWFLDSTDDPLPEFSVRGTTFCEVIDKAKAITQSGRYASYGG